MTKDRDTSISRSRSLIQFPPEIAIRGHSSGHIKPTIGIRAIVLASTMSTHDDLVSSGFTLGVSFKPNLLFPGELFLWMEFHSNYIKSQDYECWHIIERGDYVIDPALEVHNYTSREIHRIAKDHKERQLILDGLTSSDVEKVRSISTAKEMWREIQLLHQDSDNHMLDLLVEFHSFQAQTGCRGTILELYIYSPYNTVHRRMIFYGNVLRLYKIGRASCRERV